MALRMGVSSNLWAPRRDMSAIKLGGIVSGCILACLVAVFTSSGAASAGCMSQTIGNTTIHNCDGKIGTSHTVGTTTVHNFDGKVSVSQTVGATTVYNIDGKSGLSHAVGMTTVHNIGGKFGLSHTVGNVTIHSGPLFSDR